MAINNNIGGYGTILKKMDTGDDMTWPSNGTGSFSDVILVNSLCKQRVSTSALNQTSTWRKVFKAPPIISSIPANALSIEVYASNIATSLFSITAYINNVADANINNFSILPSVINVFETKTASFGSPINPGDDIMIAVQVQSNSNGQTYRIKRFEIKYY